MQKEKSSKLFCQERVIYDCVKRQIKLRIVTVLKAHPLILKRHKICFNISQNKLKRSACALGVGETKNLLEIKKKQFREGGKIVAFNNIIF